MVDLDVQALQAHGLTPSDVQQAINVQNLSLPSGTAKIGDREYNVLLNSSAADIPSMGDLPIKVVNGATVYVRDVAFVRDGNAPQTNIVRQDGTRGTLMTVLKSGNASTLDIIERIKSTVLPRTGQVDPAPELDMKSEFDQSLFVRAALNGVMKEAAIAAVLTAMMILLFLGTWRNTLVVALSIPLSILCSVICLFIFGQTINCNDFWVAWRLRSAS